MSISSVSIQKLFREHFPGETPLRLEQAEREAWIAALKQRFEDDEQVDVDKVTWVMPDRQNRHLLTLDLKDPDRRYSYRANTFRLVLDDNDDEVVIESAGMSAKVSHLDEIVTLLVECKRRLERQRTQRKRREKVRGFKNAAITAQLKEMAREERFEFAIEFGPQKVKLWIRLNEGNDALEISTSPKRFQSLLPDLPPMIRSLRETWQTGLKFKTVTRQSLPWRVEWIGHDDTISSESEQPE